MKDNLYLSPQELVAFVAIATERSFSRAGALMCLAQPTVSRRLASLERKSGVELVRRDSRSVTLTPAGELFLPIALSLLAQLRTAQEALATIAGPPNAPACSA